MNRITRLTALAVLAATSGLAAPLPIGDAGAQEFEPPLRLIARGGGGDEKPKNKKKDERTADQKELDRVADDFKAGSVSRLGERMPTGKGKVVTLRLSTSRGTYKRDEAKGALDDWFDKRKIVSVKRTSNEKLVGHYTIRLRKQGTDELKERTLTIGLRRAKLPDGTETVLLVRLEVRGT